MKKAFKNKTRNDERRKTERNVPRDLKIQPKERLKMKSENERTNKINRKKDDIMRKTKSNRKEN